MLCFALPLYAQEEPFWVLHKDARFPQEVYVSALGIGQTIQASREDAVSQLILYFDSQIEVNTASDISIQETKDSLDKTKNYSSQVVIASEAQLPSLSFTESFFNKESNEWYICAYINKEEFVKISIVEVQTSIQNIESSLKSIKKTSHFSKFINLSKTLKEMDLLQKRARQIAILDFANGERIYSKIRALKNDCFEQREQLKDRIRFSINIENDFEDILSSALEEILGNEGFICAFDAELCLKGSVKTTITKNNAGVFATPRLSIQIIDLKNNGKTLGSYTKVYKKWGHINEESAIKKAFVEVEKDLHAHFMEAFYSL